MFHPWPYPLGRKSSRCCWDIEESRWHPFQHHKLQKFGERGRRRIRKASRRQEPGVEMGVFTRGQNWMWEFCFKPVDDFLLAGTFSSACLIWRWFNNPIGDWYQTSGLALPYRSVSYYWGLAFFHICPRAHDLEKEPGSWVWGIIPDLHRWISRRFNCCDFWSSKVAFYPA